MNVPKITPSQFYVLALLFDRQRSGQDLRAGLLVFKERKTLPAFYQAMARLEDAGWVEGWYEQKTVEGNVVRERWYRITGEGVHVWKEAASFFDAVRAIPDLKPGFVW